MSSDRSSKQDITKECILRAKCNISSEMKQHECEPCSLCGGWSILYEKVSGGCCFMTQLLTAASIIKSSAVQNLNTDGPFDTVTTPIVSLRWSDCCYLTNLHSDFRVPCVWNMSLKTSEKDRLKDFSFLEKLQLAAYFPSICDDSDHGEMMSCDSPLAFWRWHITALHHSSV